RSLRSTRPLPCNESAFSASTSTIARREATTPSGSYVALSTSERGMAGRLLRRPSGVGSGSVGELATPAQVGDDISWLGRPLGVAVHGLEPEPEVLGRRQGQEGRTAPPSTRCESPHLGERRPPECRTAR